MVASMYITDEEGITIAGIVISSSLIASLYAETDIPNFDNFSIMSSMFSSSMVFLTKVYVYDAEPHINITVIFQTTLIVLTADVPLRLSFFSSSPIPAASNSCIAANFVPTVAKLFLVKQRTQIKPFTW